MFVLDLNEDIVNLFSKKDSYSGYEMANLTNLRPQMIYNYMKKGFIQTVVVDAQNRIERNEAIRWYSKYLNKKNA